MRVKDAGPIAYYVTAHGYGHGARTCDILRALHRLAPEQEVIVITHLPPAFFASRLPDACPHFRAGAFDVGLAQLDSIRADVDATLAPLRALYRGRRETVRREAEFLREAGVSMVVADIPALPLEAARAVGCPAAAVGNFGWNWIYGAYRERDPAWGEIVEAIEDGYRCADLLVRLPFSEPMTIFPRRVDVGVTASPGRPDRARLAAMTGADPERTWVLLSFTSLGWEAEAIRRVAALRQYAFFTVLPLAWQAASLYAADPADMAFSDILAACDIVVSKPGYGIVAECVANQKPLVYADRSHFLEYPILVEAIQDFLVHAHVPVADLYAGRLEDALADVAAAPPPPKRIALGGADEAAHALLSLRCGADIGGA